MPTLLGSSFKEFSIKDTFEGTGKSLKVEWILGDNDLVCVCVCVCVCVHAQVCVYLHVFSGELHSVRVSAWVGSITDNSTPQKVI